MTCPYSRLITAFSRYVKAFCTDTTIKKKTAIL